jgi:hypothetical protein
MIEADDAVFVDLPVRGFIAGIAEDAIPQLAVAVAGFEDRRGEAVGIGGGRVNLRRCPGPERPQALRAALRQRRSDPREKALQIGIVEMEIPPA